MDYFHFHTIQCGTLHSTFSQNEELAYCLTIFPTYIQGWPTITEHRNAIFLSSFWTLCIFELIFRNCTEAFILPRSTAREKSPIFFLINLPNLKMRRKLTQSGQLEID